LVHGAPGRRCEWFASRRVKHAQRGVYLKMPIGLQA